MFPRLIYTRVDCYASLIAWRADVVDHHE